MAEAELTSDLKDRAIAYIFALAVGPTTQDLRIDNSSHQQVATYLLSCYPKGRKGARRVHHVSPHTESMLRYSGGEWGLPRRRATLDSATGQQLNDQTHGREVYKSPFHDNEACGVKLTVDILDEILMEMLVVDGTVLEAAGLTPLRYLLECFDRAAGVRQGGAQHHQWAVGVAGGVAVEQEPAVQQFATGLQKMVGQFVVTVVKQAEDAQQPAASASGLLQLGGPGAQQAASPVVAELMTTLQSPQRGLDSFLHYMAAELPPEDHADMLRPVVEQLMKRASTMSILGDFSPVLETVIRLLEIKPLALALTTLGKCWLPEAEAARNANNEASRGRLLQLDTLLGSLLAISGLLDRGSIFPASPDVGKELFGDTASSRNSVVESGFRLLRQLQGQLHGLLHVVVKTLLGKGTRSAMLDWLAAAIEWNSGRSKMGCQPFNVASDGLFLNLCGVLLKLCEPFLDLHSGKFFDKVDVRYISGMGLKTRISFQGETRLAASEEEQWKWQEEALARAGNPEAEPAHFILDCFFMTAKALHLGFVTEIQMVFELASNIQREQHVLQRLRANPATPEQHITMTENHVKAVKQMLLLYQGTLVDVELLRKVLSYYRLMAVWLLRLACPSFAAGGSVTLPLPDTCPPHLACIPEYFLLDLIESLTFIAAAAPQVMEENCMEELVVFLVVFMSSATFVRNPHLRYKLAEVLVSWLPNHPNQSMREGTARAQRTLDFLFEAHPLVRSDLVRSLLRVYVDVEQTDRANQFYEKFQMRSKLSMLLHRLWTIPSHREEWKKMAAEDSGTGMYQRFCNMLVNDAIFLLDESIKSLMAMREMEEKLEPPPGRPQPSQQARQRISAQLQEAGQHLKYFLQGATSSIHTIQITSQDIAEPFLMKSFLDRSAEMLNYFLKYLTGPERAKLKVKNMEQYSFNPKELLTAICNIYINLATADSSGGFVRSIAGDGRSYREEMFEEAARVLRDHRLMYPERIAELDNLSTQVLAARQSLEQEEMDMGEVPDEFLDPITYSLMADPVLLPTSNVTCDRSNITRHLLSEESDPFNRARLTVHDLVPNTELKARIEAWLASHGRDPSSKAG